MKKKVLVVALLAAFSAPSHAIWGVADTSFDPASYGELVNIYKQMVETYKTMKQQLDTAREVERTLKDAQQTYQTIANTKMKDLTSGFKLDNTNTKTAAGMRAELERMGGNAEGKADYIKYQMARIKQLENLELLQKVSATNVNDTTGKINALTAEKITAQSTATLATLAAAEEQRRAQADITRATAAKAELDSLAGAKNVYDALGK